MRTALAALLVALALSPAASAAQTYHVSTTADAAADGECVKTCTLRDAIALAVAGDTVSIPKGTYQLTQGELSTHTESIVGVGARDVVIKAAPSSRVIHVGGQGTTGLAGVTLTGGAPVAAATAPEGGGVLIDAGSTLVISASTVATNAAPTGGGIMVNGELRMDRSTVSGNTATSGDVTAGGGITVAARLPLGTTVVATLTNSTVSGNTASGGRTTQGGGISTDGALTLNNTTVAGNRVTGTGTLAGAGIYQGLGVGQGTPPTAVIRNSIVAGNTGGACAGDPTIWDEDHNIDDDGSCGFGAVGDKPGVNPLLGPLAANGGPTSTQALSFASPAINAGTKCAALTDQRGRPREGACDIGAFEFIHPRLTVITLVVNDQGGTRVPGQFNVHVRRGADVAGSPAAGTAAGRTYTLIPGTYTVAADADARYTAATSGACTATGAVALAESQTKTCVLVENDKPPVAGKLVNAEPARGTVLFRRPQRKRFRTLSEGQQLPVGTTFDTRKGRVTLFAAADKNGGIAKAVFYGGIFRVGQTKGKHPITVLTLVEKLTGCQAKGKATTARKKKRRRSLWGDGHGRFRTKGRHSAATVVGTKWLVQDRCTSTLTRVVRGRVKVRDFVKHKTVTVRKGHRYIARAS